MAKVQLVVYETRKVVVDVELDCYPEDKRCLKDIIEIETEAFEQNVDYMDNLTEMAAEKGYAYTHTFEVLSASIIEENE